MSSKKIKASDLGINSKKYEELLVKVRELFNSGYGKIKISKELDISLTLVSKLLEDKSTVVPVTKPTTKQNLEDENMLTKVAGLISKGLGIIEISKELDITVNSALYWSNKVQNGGKANLVDEIRKALDKDSFETYDLAKRYTKTPAAINRLVRKAEMEFSPAADWVRTAAKKGIKYSRLQRELKVKTLERAKEIVQEAFKDCFVITTPYQDDYILTPVYSSKEETEWINIDTSKRKFDYYVSPEGNYMTVKFHDSIEANKIRIVQLSDIHVGSIYFRKGLFERAIKDIKKDPNCFVVLTGDVIECIAKATAGGSWEQYSNINEQVEEFVQLVKPIEDRIIFSVAGNHEDRVERLSEFSLSRVIANILKVPFFNVMAFIDLHFKDQKYTVAATHFYAKNLFGQAQIVTRVKQIMSNNVYPVNIFLSGHTHTSFIQCEYTATIVPGKGKVPFEYIVANSGSFTQHTGSYSEKAGYYWSPQGVINFSVDNEGNLEVWQTKINPI